MKRVRGEPYGSVIIRLLLERLQAERAAESIHPVLMTKPGIPADATGRLAADHAVVLGRFGGDGIAHGGVKFSV